VHNLIFFGRSLHDQLDVMLARVYCHLQGLMDLLCSLMSSLEIVGAVNRLKGVREQVLIVHDYVFAQSDATATIYFITQLFIAASIRAASIQERRL